MKRILGIDYGTKRTGLAATDPLQIIVSPLETVPTGSIWEFLANYLAEEPVELVVLGEPLHADGTPAQIHHLVVGFARKFEKTYPDIPVVWQDERFTSERAKQVILDSGTKKKKRQDKSLVDKVSAAIILQDYLEENKY